MALLHLPKQDKALFTNSNFFIQMAALRLNVYIDCLLKEIKGASGEAVKSVHLLAVAASISDEGQKQVLDHVIPALSSPFTVSLSKSPFPTWNTST